MSSNHYTPELHAKFRALLTPDILDGTITINYGGTNDFDVYTNLPIHRPIKQNKPELNITGLIAEVPALLDEIDRLNEQVAQAWEHAIDTAYTHYLTEEQRDHLITLNPHKETHQ